MTGWLEARRVGASDESGAASPASVIYEGRRRATKDGARLPSFFNDSRLPGPTWLLWVAQVSLASTESYRLLAALIGFYRVLLFCIGFYRILVSTLTISRNRSVGTNALLMGLYLTHFHLVLADFDWSSWLHIGIGHCCRFWIGLCELSEAMGFFFRFHWLWSSPSNSVLEEHAHVRDPLIGWPDGNWRGGGRWDEPDNALATTGRGSRYPPPPPSAVCPTTAYARRCLLRVEWGWR